MTQFRDRADLLGLLRVVVQAFGFVLVSIGGNTANINRAEDNIVSFVRTLVFKAIMPPRSVVGEYVGESHCVRSFEVVPKTSEKID